MPISRREPASGVFEPGHTPTCLSTMEAAFGFRVTERTIRLAPPSLAGG